MSLSSPDSPHLEIPRNGGRVTRRSKNGHPFAWRPQHEAAGLVYEWVAFVIEGCCQAHHLRDRMLKETGTRFEDWIDHLIVPWNAAREEKLAQVGFEMDEQDGPVGRGVWRHPGGLFPAILLREGRMWRCALRVESVTDFLLAHGLTACEVRGQPMATTREATIAHEQDIELTVIERHGTNSLGFLYERVADPTPIMEQYEIFLLRRRGFTADAEGFAHLENLVDAAVMLLGVDLACDVFFRAERAYWQSRNAAARTQRARQDLLGLGWANHDHHTYRSSRDNFARLVAIFERLGFACRERFYAGAEAGWGAQVLEQPRAGVVVFADVDLSPEEVTIDFAHTPLPERDHVGTVGLWCALHGDSILQAGMHHLECQFDFDAVRVQLHALGVGTMKPFTDLPHLRQAFTAGEQWSVRAARIERALRRGWIDYEQARRFHEYGSLGSHMEILQREEGYKGFNQAGINDIIRDTDPRTH